MSILPFLQGNAENGIYALCWCRETADHKCEQLQDYKADAGTFIYVGPNRINPTRTILGDIFEARFSLFLGVGIIFVHLLLKRHVWIPGVFLIKFWLKPAISTVNRFKLCFGNSTPQWAVAQANPWNLKRWKCWNRS